MASNVLVGTSRILACASLSSGLTVIVRLRSLPPRPARYRRTGSIGMLLQWLLLSVIGICFSSLAALNSQTRLMLGKYLEFYVTEKATKNQ